MCFVYAVTWKETERAAGRQSQNVFVLFMQLLGRKQKGQQDDRAKMF